MRSQALRSAVRGLRHVAAPPSGSDAELLRTFATRRDAAAFEQIVRRHGPMVLGVCRRVLRDPADADDAFQATFLVLVRKAGSLRAPDRLAGWLHQVAHRVARKARAVRLSRAHREGELFDTPAGEPPAEVVWRELRPIFDAEVDRLPDRLRLPAVLCLLEGRSKREAAESLGWPEGTLSCRLQRARERLRVRLSARGLTLSVGVLAAALFEGAGSAMVPDRLIASTVHGVLSPAAAAGARALADGVTQAMFLTKLKVMAAGVLVAGVVGTGTGVALVPGSGPGAAVAGEPAKDTPAKEPAPAAPREVDRKKGPVDLDRVVKEQELELLKERLAFEERMVAKGYMTEAQVKKTRLEVARAEAAAAKGDTSKLDDPRRAAAEEVIRKLEQIVEQTRQGVRRGIVPHQELLNSEATLARYKFDLLTLHRPPAAAAPVPPEQRAALEAIVQKLEEIAARTEEGVKAGVIPHQELLNAQAKVLEYKFKLVQLAGPPATGLRAVRPDRAPAIAARERELTRAEELLQRKAITEEAVRRLRIELARLRAEAATDRGDHAEAARQRDAVVGEHEAQATAIRRLAEQKVVPRSEQRAAEVALAEARVEALRAGLRRQLAEIVRAREEDLREVRALHKSDTVPAADVLQAERALAEARTRLAAEH